MANPTKKDRDEITVAKSIFDEIVEMTEAEPDEETVNKSRSRKGGQARSQKLTPEERQAIATKAANARWKNK